jgi:hypothetical protein
MNVADTAAVEHLLASGLIRHPDLAEVVLRKLTRQASTRTNGVLSRGRSMCASA